MKFNVQSTKKKSCRFLKKKFELKQILKKINLTQIKTINKKMTSKTFDVKIKIVLSIKNLNINKSKKNSNKFTKKFLITKKIEKQIYRLKLSFQWRIHFVFHIFLLKKFHENIAIDLFFEMKLIDDQKKWQIIKKFDVKNKKNSNI